MLTKDTCIVCGNKMSERLEKVRLCDECLDALEEDKNSRIGRGTRISHGVERKRKNGNTKTGNNNRTKDS
jgi:hypothetical protein